ncbi:MAG TPA: peptide chain release factor 2 [Clostridiaceae bacterium]|nr:peptide chain release factor 2 [Clostridiaceae bacterium]
MKYELEGMEEDLQTLQTALHIDETRDRVAELEARAQEPDFWNDAERAQEIQTQITRMTRRIKRMQKLRNEWEDLIVLCEMGAEEGDKDLLVETKESVATFKQEYENLRLETLFTGEYDHLNAILTLHAGAGGTEAQDWTSMLYRMYLRWAEDHGFQVAELDYLDGDEAGIKTVSFMISGENAYGYLRSEMGVHRLVRISPFDSSGRRHTSFASLEVLPELDNSIEIDIRPEDLRVDTYRASGAGGQHVNKTSSAVRMTHLPTGVVVQCQSERSQIQNRETCMTMLKSKLFALAQQAQLDRIEDLKGNQMEIAWGSQIRSYVFCPYTMVKDHRTNYEEGNVDAVMDGELDGFINAWLARKQTTAGDNA